MVMQRWVVRLIGLVSTIILARVLLPEDFGVVALATTMFVVLDSVMELGFDLALIQNQSDGRKRYNTAWSLCVLRGLFVASVLLMAAWPFAALYDDPRLLWVMLWLAAVAVLNGLLNIGVVEFRKELRFDREFVLLVGSKVVGFITTIGLVFIWRDYRALIAGIVASKAATVLLSYAMHSYRPSFSLEGARGFVHFSKWLGASNIMMILKTRLDTFVIGKFAGTDALGIYSVAAEIANLASTELVAPISRVLFPGFSQISSDRERLARTFLDSLGIIMLIAAPLALGVAITAEHIVYLFLGERWMTAVPIIQVLALFGLLNLALANSGALYLALGRTDLLFYRDLPSVIVLIPSLILATKYYGAIGAAWSLVGGAGVALITHLVLLRRQLKVSIPSVGAVAWRPLCSAVGMLLVLQHVPGFVPAGNGALHHALQLAILVGCGAVAYTLLCSVLWLLAGRPDGAERRIFALLLLAVARKKQRA